MRLPSKIENNRAALFLVGAAGGVGGSVVSVILIASAVWALTLLLFKRLPLALTRSDLPLLIATTLYVLVYLVAAVVNGMVPADLRVFYPVFTFLFPWLIISRLRLSPPGDLLGAFALGAAFCGLLALPLALYQSSQLGMRVEGGAGNALPFALLSCLSGQIGLLNAIDEKRWKRMLGWAGYLAAFICLVLSESKGLLPPMLLGPIVLLIVFPEARRSVFCIRSFAILVVAVLIVAPFSQALIARVEMTTNYLLADDTATVADASTSERLVLWERAFELAADRPLLGYGMQNRVALIKKAKVGDYGHFHNGYLTSLVDAGLAGLTALLFLLLSPLVIAARVERDEYYKKRLFLALVLTGTYGLGGMTNLIFWHDIYDSMFQWVSMLVAASVPISAGNPLIWRRGANA